MLKRNYGRSAIEAGRTALVPSTWHCSLNETNERDDRRPVQRINKSVQNGAVSYLLLVGRVGFELYDVLRIQ